MKHSESISAYAKKAEIIGRVMMRKVATSRKARPLSVCECLIVIFTMLY